MQTETALPPAERENSRFPCKKRRHMPGSLTTPGCPSTCVGVLDHIAFRYLYSVGTQDIPIPAQWLACALPYADARRYLDRSLELVPGNYKMVGPLNLDAAEFGAATRRPRLNTSMPCRRALLTGFVPLIRTTRIFLSLRPCLCLCLCLCLSWPLTLLQSYAWTTAVFVNEFDPGGFQSSTHRQIIGGGH
jgi:hypothetical protein